MSKYIQALSIAQDFLLDAALNESFEEYLFLAFGDNYDTNLATSIFSAFGNQSFSNLPAIEILSSDTLGNANGAFALSTNTIYLSDLFLNNASTQQIAGVILEEIGHWIDSQINIVDSEGDEGAIFSALLQGIELTPDEWQYLPTEDDTAIITIDGYEVMVEQNVDINSIVNNIRSILSRNLGSAFNIRFNNPTFNNPFNFFIEPHTSVDSTIRAFLPTISGLVNITGNNSYSLDNIILDTGKLLGQGSFIQEMKNTLGLIIEPIKPVADILLKPVPLLNDLYNFIGGNGLNNISKYDTNDKSISLLDVIGFVASARGINFDPTLIIQGVETFDFFDNINLREGVNLGSVIFDGQSNFFKQNTGNINLQ